MHQRIILPARLCGICLALILLPSLFPTIGCARRHVRTVGLMSISSDGSDRKAAADTLDFAAEIDRYATLSSVEQESMRQRAENKADAWRGFELEAYREKDSFLRHWYYLTDPLTFDHFGVGLGNSIIDLKAATRLDPSFAEGWSNLGRLCAEVGDLTSARKYLERALLAARIESDAGRPLNQEQYREIYRDLAWTYRDLTLWDKGLATVNEGLSRYSGDRELVLIKGLLLAGNGQVGQAISLAVRMEPLSYPQYDFIYRGFKHQTSSYANNWIKSQALLAAGDIGQAYFVLGDLPTLSYRTLLPFSNRYWRDAGLIAELAGDPEAPTYYAVGHVTLDYLKYYPLISQSIASQVLDVPNPWVPVYTSYGNRFYAGGSPLSYVGGQMAQMNRGLFPLQKSLASGQALQMLNILERRNVRPDVCRALRGRIYYANDDFALARVELTAAHGSFAAQDQIDAGTSLILGLLHMQTQEYAKARELLGESVTAGPTNPVAWRSLGVVNVQLGRIDEAHEAMDRSVALDPWTVTSFYNRGLLHLQLKEFELARVDLDRALQLDPDNREVQRLLQMTTVALIATDPVEPVVTATSEGPLAEYEADPLKFLAQLEADVEALFDLPDSLHIDNPEALARFAELETRYAREPTPELRSVLALGYIDQKMDQDAQAILAPGWGIDLSPQEELMLLFVDRNLGEIDRAQQVVQDILSSGSGSGNPYALAIAVDAMRTGIDPVGEDAKSSNNHGFFGWWRNAKFSYGQDITGRPRMVWDSGQFFRYQSDQLFEQAVWGMRPTPLAGGQNGVNSLSQK